MAPMLDIKNLKVAYRNAEGWLEVVRGIDICLENGEIVAMLGESGAGKTASALSIAMLIDPADGHVASERHMFDGRSVSEMTEKELCNLRGKRVAYVFQNAVEALSPNKRIREQFKEGFDIHKIPYSEGDIRNILTEVGLDEHDVILGMFPHQLSGGQAQRVMIAMAVSLKPDMIIADEPTSAVDASLKGRILDLLRQINTNHGISMLVITHDFDVARELCHRVIVLYGGLEMETCSVEELMTAPMHPYSAELMTCVESINASDKRLHTLEGTTLNPVDFKDVCPFVQRCAFHQPECETGIPEITEYGTRAVRCLFPLVHGGSGHE